MLGYGLLSPDKSASVNRLRFVPNPALQGPAPAALRVLVPTLEREASRLETGLVETTLCADPGTSNFAALFAFVGERFDQHPRLPAAGSFHANVNCASDFALLPEQSAGP